MTIFTAKERKCSFQHPPAASLSSVQSEMFCLQPEWQTPFHHIKSGLFTCQTEHIYWQHNFSLSASHCQKRNETERERNFHEFSVSYTSSSWLPSPPTQVVSLTSVETLAALRWLFASNYLVGSTLTQLRLHISSSSSSASAFLGKSKTPSLTSTPTHLQNRFELQLCSDLSLALSTLFPPWLFSHIGANAGSAQIWSWVDSGHLHFDSKPAVHQLWLWLISALELQNQASSLSNPKCQQDFIFYLKSCLHS